MTWINPRRPELVEAFLQKVQEEKPLVLSVRNNRLELSFFTRMCEAGSKHPELFAWTLAYFMPRKGDFIERMEGAAAKIRMEIEHREKVAADEPAQATEEAERKEGAV